MSGQDYRTAEDGASTSYMHVEWTNQHGCGGNEDTDPHKQNCELVMQFMCEPDQVNAATGRALKHNINLKM